MLPLILGTILRVSLSNNFTSSMQKMIPKLTVSLVESHLSHYGSSKIVLTIP